MSKINKWISVLMLAVFSMQSTLAIGSTGTATESASSIEAKRTLSDYVAAAKNDKLLDEAIELFQELRNDIEDDSFKTSFMVNSYSKKMGINPKSFLHYPSFLSWVDQNKIYLTTNDDSFQYTFRAAGPSAVPIIIKKGQRHPTRSDAHWTKIIAGGLVQPDGSMPDNWEFSHEGFVQVTTKDTSGAGSPPLDPPTPPTEPETEIETGTCRALTALDLIQTLQGKCVGDHCNLTSKVTDDPALADYTAMWPSIYDGKGGAEDDRCSAYFEVFGEHETYTMSSCTAPTDEQILELRRGNKQRDTLQNVDVATWAEAYFPSSYNGKGDLGQLGNHKECTSWFNSHGGEHAHYLMNSCVAPEKIAAFNLYMLARADASVMDSDADFCPVYPPLDDPKDDQISELEIDEDNASGNEPTEGDETDPETKEDDKKSELKVNEGNPSSNKPTGDNTLSPEQQKTYWFWDGVFDGSGLNNAFQFPLNNSNINGHMKPFGPLFEMVTNSTDTNTVETTTSVNNSINDANSEVNSNGGTPANNSGTSGIVSALMDTFWDILGTNTSTKTPTAKPSETPSQPKVVVQEDQQVATTVHAGWNAVSANNEGVVKDRKCQRTYKELQGVGEPHDDSFDKGCVVPDEAMLAERDWLKQAP